MAFSQTNILQVYVPQVYGNQLLVRWESSAPNGTWYQVYADGSLAWVGQTTQASIPIQPGNMLIDVGTVDAADAYTDYAADLSWPENRAILKWVGGTFESANLSGFHVYQSPAANQLIDYSTYVADINAYIGGIITDGYGFGTYGGGLYGSSSASYSWTSGTLTTGTWGFGVKPYDNAGNEGPAQEGYQFWGLPPQPPGVWPGNGRTIHYTMLYTTGEGYGNGGYGNGSYPGVQAILTWVASPG